jgi:hypothetical protein
MKTILEKLKTFLSSGKSFTDGFEAGYEQAKLSVESDSKVGLKAFAEGYKQGYQHGRYDKQRAAELVPLGGEIAAIAKKWHYNKEELDKTEALSGCGIAGKQCQSINKNLGNV